MSRDRGFDAPEPLSALADQDQTASTVADSLLSSPLQIFSACDSQGQQLLLQQQQQQLDAHLDAVPGEAGQSQQQQQRYPPPGHGRPHLDTSSSPATGPGASEAQSEITAVQDDGAPHGLGEAGRHQDSVAPLLPTQHTGSEPTAYVLHVPAAPTAPSPAAAAQRPLAALSTSVKVRQRRCSLWRVFLRRRTPCHSSGSGSAAHGGVAVRGSGEGGEGMRAPPEAGRGGSGASCTGSGRRGWWWSGRGSSRSDDDPFDVESVDTFFDRPSYNLDMELSALGLQQQGQQPNEQQGPKDASPAAASTGADSGAGGIGQPTDSPRVTLTGRWGWKDDGAPLRRWGSMSGAASSPRSGVGAGAGAPGAAAVQLVSRFGALAAAVEALVEVRAMAPGEGQGQGGAHVGPREAPGGACSGALPVIEAPAGPLEHARGPWSGDGGRQGCLEEQQQQHMGCKGTGEVGAAGEGPAAGEAAAVAAGRVVLSQLLQLQEDTLAALLRKVRAAGHRNRRCEPL